ncbi:hypothetical protein [Amaricoccus sp.]|uniref:hypothetical protein n=1 Tax=Amaricoccus sp. TaxID=1872485 RepID=UPI001B5A9375|nr:hypothetical protein [Amaricoccus sp.]MBP7002051.1 hypothetical protein [Amaricoccus sp.]
MRTLAISLALMLLSASVAPAQANTICTLVADAPTGTALLEEGDCGSRVTPASTFKVPLAVAAQPEPETAMTDGMTTLRSLVERIRA